MHTHRHTHTHTDTRTHTLSLSPSSLIHTHVRIRAHTHNTHTHTLSLTFTCTCTCLHTDTHTCMHMDTNICTLAHTHVHTHTRCWFQLKTDRKADATTHFTTFSLKPIMAHLRWDGAVQGQHWNWSAWYQYTVTGWHRQCELQLLFQCYSIYYCLNRSVPEIHYHVVGKFSYWLTTVLCFHFRQRNIFRLGYGWLAASLLDDVHIYFR